MSLLWPHFHEAPPPPAPEGLKLVGRHFRAQAALSFVIVKMAVLVGMVLNAFLHPSTQVDLSEFQVSLIYVMNSRPPKAA